MMFTPCQSPQCYAVGHAWPMPDIPASVHAQLGEGGELRQQTGQDIVQNNSKVNVEALVFGSLSAQLPTPRELQALQRFESCQMPEVNVIHLCLPDIQVLQVWQAAQGAQAQACTSKVQNWVLWAVVS